MVLLQRWSLCRGLLCKNGSIQGIVILLQRWSLCRGFTMQEWQHMGNSGPITEVVLERFHLITK